MEVHQRGVAPPEKGESEMPTRLQCRRLMHYAEHLARTGRECPAIYLPRVESAYLSTHCETAVAKRLHVALELI
jgi:hypothetical protein